MINKYRKKPIVIEAIQYLENNLEEVYKFIMEDKYKTNVHQSNKVIISTLEGVMEADVNDYIIKGIKGEFYPCKPDIFKATYETVNLKL